MKKSALITIFLLTFSGIASAQYYDWGQDPASVKWRTMKTPDVTYVYPDYYQRNATRLMHYMDTIRNDIGYGFRHGPLRKMPLVMHTQNFQSNGLVMLAPKRMEFIVNPGTDNPAFPWLKQLAAHEYRHAVQYNNLNRHFTKVLSYVLGQQASLVGLIYLPYWLLEGDAVLAETEMSTFGRGKQPSFSIDYRAMEAEDEKRFPADKYFSGSFKDFMPDVYRVGYQIASYSYTKYGQNIWDKVAWYGSTYPYLFATTRISLKKYYGTTVNKLFRETFDDLKSHWEPFSMVENSSRIIPTPTTSYTTYSHPIYTDKGVIYVLKTDLDKTSRLVAVDPESGEEELLCYTGAVSSGMVFDGRDIYWTEYRQSTFWEQRVNSVLCSYDTEKGKKGLHRRDRSVLYPTIGKDGVALIRYNYEGSFTIEYNDRELDLPDTLSVNGMTYDELTNRLYFIALSDAGMWIGSADSELSGYRMETIPSYAAINNLRAADGKLYYNSIASGKDEAHEYDMASGVEYKLTDSRYGSFAPYPAGNGNYAVTTFTRDGYMLAMQDGRAEEFAYRKVPEDILSPPRLKWDVMNLDEVTVSDTTTVEVKKYRKGTHIFNFHSWAPVYFDPDEVSGETSITLKLGVSAFSQSTLNSTFTTVGYYWDGDDHYVRAKVNYYGLAPKFEVEAIWGSKNQNVHQPSNYIIISDRLNNLNKYWDVTARVYLPILLSSGHHIRRLTPNLEYEYTNSLLFDIDDMKFKTGLHKLVASVSFIDNIRMAHRDFLPRWGYALQFISASNPFDKKVGTIWTGYARAYMPGILPHHSTTVRAAAQHHNLKTYNFRQKILFPRGADYRIIPRQYASVSLDYQFPFWYPDGGISSIIYFKRFRLNLLADYARLKYYDNKTDNLYTYGGELIMDIAPMRLPESKNATFKISVYKPSDSGGVTVGASFSLPF